LKDLIDGNADVPVALPNQLPATTVKSEEVNSHQQRFSDTPLHKNLHSNITSSIMSYVQYPFPAKISPELREKYGPDSPYIDRELVREWVEDIFVRNGHDKRLELNTTVEKAEKKDGKWVLTLRKEEAAKNYWWQESFDALVVASGHYNLPWFPKIPGLLEYNAKFPGRILHSKHFRDARKYKER
jgi:cation diffusion facilitator CzcD-associated flavoprotein CzcO